MNRLSVAWAFAIALGGAACDGGTHMTGDGWEPPQEVCNGRDDDDDGLCDDGYDCCANSIVACDTSCGSAGWRRCTADCRISAGEICQKPAESCNGIDDDCDGQTDEEPECNGRWLWQNPMPTWNTLHSVAPAADGTAIVVGAGGVIARWDSTRWTPMFSPTINDLRGVAAVPDGTAFAVGLGGTILRLEAGVWSHETRVTTVNLHAIWVASATSAFAVGDQGTILRWNGSTWTASTAGTAEDLFGVWGTASNDVFAVGGHRVLAHFDGTTWNAEQPYTDEGWLEAVWGSASDNVYAAGRDGWVLRFDGTAWRRVAAPTEEDLWDAWGTGAGDVFLAGARGAVLHYDGTAWAAMASGAGTTALRGLGGTGPADVWAVGEYGTVLRYRGASWAALEHGPQDNLSTILAMPGGEMLAVGQHEDTSLNLWTSVLWGDATGWRADLWTIRGQLTDAWVGGADDVWAVGPAGAVFHWDGTAWNRVTFPTTADLEAIWGPSPTSIYVAGENGTLLHWDGMAWTELTVDPPLTRTLNDIRGLGPDDVWAVGNDGAIIHWDGIAWTGQTTGSHVNFHAVAPASPTMVVAVGEQPGTSGAGTGAIVRWDGSRWIPDEDWVPTPMLDVVAVSTDNVYAVSGASAWHFDGTNWTALATTGVGRSLSADVFRALVVDPVLGLVTAGGHGAILHWAPSAP
jgi:hypothetical protein